MKKLISIMSTLAVLFSMIGGAFAVDDIMTPANEYERGTKVPSYGTTWNLSKDYIGSFDFDSTIYTNYNFTGKSTIKVAVSSTTNNPDYYIKTFYASLYQKNRFTTKFVGKFECQRAGKTSHSFNVDSGNQYFVELSKAADGCWLSGTLSVYS
ncbi:hypothetical protein [Butyricicoccus sp. AM78-15b2TA]|uniref:hypothetical protein n=1 Tax=Butyricicoccus sp. AM78-15b2TA TaxID=3002516 RepID=UPI0022E916D7|nr:hypothetical protein [Butyricicoccus sp. AM78-15b2TA]